MQITVEELSAVKKKLSFEVPAERVSIEIDRAYDKIRKNAAIKGFRKGKAPQSYIEKHYVDVMADDVLRKLFNEAYYKSLAEYKVMPVSHPLLESDEVVRGQALKFSATVDVLPEIEDVEFKGLSVTKELYVADPTRVEDRLQQFRENMAEYATADAGYEAANSDMVVMDFTGYLDGVPFEGGHAQDHQLLIGSGNFIPGFEEQLIGMTAGSEREIKVTFPAEYHSSELAGKEVSFAINLKEIKNRVLPELDDDFAKEVGEFENMEQLRARLTETIEKQEKERIESELRENIVKVIVEKNPLEVPESIVDKQVEQMLESAKKRLASQRLSLEMMGMTEERYKEDFRDVARQKVKSSLLLSALARKEGMKVEDADIDLQLKKISEENGQNFDKLKEFYMNNEQARDAIVDYIIDEKVFAFLIANIEITEIAKG